MSTIVTMSDRGRITIPSRIREALHLDDNAQLRLDVVDDTLIITPAIVIAREDAWAYTPEESAAIERALHSPVVPGVTDEDLAAIAAADDPEQAARDLIARRLHA
ncbi:MAG: AbrB/MazE/SpoVT family DNA-binding domain-containing protein [Thermomicrobia bacterium]|nr:AbrB/MazE/SpoVT family DNA-binding domain-containing protein [Thermomicrobia bacterium]MCA1725031.1 AbrB/MazE/SpoVT family DNA-binding domain-containing protein [Thermomicrobia bacterium]